MAHAMGITEGGLTLVINGFLSLHNTNYISETHVRQGKEQNMGVTDCVTRSMEEGYEVKPILRVIYS